MNKNIGFNPKKQLISLAILIILIGITFYVILTNFVDFDIKVFSHLITRLDLKFLILAVTALLLYIIFEGLSMQLVASSIGCRYGFITATVYSCVDLYFSAITPSATGGQPAVAYYMSKNGIPLTKSSTILLVNIVQYTVSLLLMGLIVLIANTKLIVSGGHILVLLFIIGFVTNILLLVIFLMCMFWQKLVQKIGIGILQLLCKLHILKHKEARISALDMHLKEYHSCMELIRSNPKMLIGVLIGNVLQRLSIFSIAYFIYRSFGLSGQSYWTFIALQIISAVAVNALPIPGAVGAAEGAFLAMYSIIYSQKLLMPAMLLTRGISYYACFIICGVITILYHIHLVRKARRETRRC